MSEKSTDIERKVKSISNDEAVIVKKILTLNEVLETSLICQTIRPFRMLFFCSTTIWLQPIIFE